jgi:hypothetical protein
MFERRVGFDPALRQPILSCRLEVKVKIGFTAS